MADTYGEFAISSRNGDVWIDRADKKILINAEFYAQISMHPSTVASITNGVLTVVGINRKVSYNIGEFLPVDGCFVLDKISDSEEKP